MDSQVDNPELESHTALVLHELRGAGLRAVRLEAGRILVTGSALVTVQEVLAELVDDGLVRCSAHPFGVEVIVVAG